MPCKVVTSRVEHVHSTLSLGSCNAHIDEIYNFSVNKVEVLCDGNLWLITFIRVLTIVVAQRVALRWAVLGLTYRLIIIYNPKYTLQNFVTIVIFMILFIFECIILRVCFNKWGEPAASHRWTGHVWGITSRRSSRLQEKYRSFQRKLSNIPPFYQENSIDFQHVMGWTWKHWGILTDYAQK